jgi:hypothetical protein
MDVSVPDASDRPAFTKRIYRTISGDLGTTLYFVAEILLTDVSYVDTATDDAISLNSQNESLNYFPPPDDLEGIIVHPNGFLVGFVGRDIYFSDPYRPHAWPTDYILSTRDNIVGLGQFGNSIVVLTDGAPAVASGNTPENITLKHSDFTEPCLSKYGIVNMPFGVYFPGPNGLMLVNSQGINNATKDLLTKDDWRLNYFPNLISAARWQDFYIAFYTDSNGFMFAPSEPQAAFTTIDGYWYQDYFATDHNTGEVLMVRENNVYEWNPPAGVPKTYVWRSKEFRLPKPVNLSAFRIYWDVNYLTEEQVAMVSEYNEQRIAAGPLNTFAMHPLNSSDIYDLSQYYPYSKMPFGGSPLIDTTVAGDSTLIFRLYANGELKHTESIANEGMYRLPSGFKDDRYYIELEGKVNIKSVRIAETGKELQRA